MSRQCKKINNQTTIESKPGKVEKIIEDMEDCRNIANDTIPNFDFKLYFQRVGRYAYLRWRGEKVVLSTRNMKKRLTEELADEPEEVRSNITHFNGLAEDLNLQYSMELKIQQAKLEK